MSILPLARFRSTFVDIEEGQSGFRHLTFTIELSAAPESAVMVSFASSNGSALAGQDYDRRGGSLTFAPGETAKIFLVRVLGDTVHEANETFTMEITAVTGGGAADVTRQSALATIVDNDPLTMPAAFFVTEYASIAEGASGSRNMVFTVGLTEAALTTVRVSFATSNGSARAGEDYAARDATLVFAPGETRKTFAVPISGDLAFEANETFYLDLTGVTGGAVLATARTSALGTIVNDDVPSLPAAFFATEYVDAKEGNAGTKSLVFTVALSTAAATTVRVGFETSNGSAQAGVDYLARSGTVSFAAGETRKSFAVTLLGDTAFEANETFYVDLTSVAGGAVLGSERTTAIATIVNDDPVPATGDVWT